ncbi:hypothetical protein C4573_03645 [Candidatus Woesearchaeota archaeon]|nr:MAG: hypothetical protein C4573_03645 [Candidatus Woesearchaeota archaeon]
MTLYKKKTLYDNVLFLEKLERRIDESLHFLATNGYAIERNPIDIKEASDKFLAATLHFGENSVVSRLRSGERLDNIVDEYIGERKYWHLLFHKKERQAYNAKVDELSAIIDAEDLKVTTLSPIVMGVVGLVTYGLGALVGTSLIAEYASKYEQGNAQPIDTLETGLSLAILVGVLYYATKTILKDLSSNKPIREKLQPQIDKVQEYLP